MGILGKISDFINTNHLLTVGKKYIVALSGGADSVALALFLKSLGYDIEAAHCNFHLRGDESDRDESFCVGFCKANGIRLHIAHFDTVSYSRLHKVSIEMAARNLRYSYFEQLKKDICADAVCVAHHQDDSVETVLLNLIRGTGIHGLTGISAKRDDIVRPLLCVSRSDIEAELKRMGQGFVTDSTNLVDDVMRNKVRLDILPLMRGINPSLNASISKMAERLGRISDVFDSMMADAARRAVTKHNTEGYRIDMDVIKDVPYSEDLLFFILKDFSFNSPQVEQIYKSSMSVPGKVFSSSSHRLLVDRNCLIVEPSGGSCPSRMDVPEEGFYSYNGNVKFRVERFECIGGVHIDKARNLFFADASKVKFPVCIRTVERADSFVPFGMKGSKLVSDYLTDCKLNLFDKQRQLVLTDADDNIIWVVGMRPDNRSRVTEATRTVLKITYINVSSM